MRTFSERGKSSFNVDTFLQSTPLFFNCQYTVKYSAILVRDKGILKYGLADCLSVFTGWKYHFSEKNGNSWHISVIAEVLSTPAR